VFDDAHHAAILAAFPDDQEMVENLRMLGSQIRQLSQFVFWTMLFH
jgi:hypothetical protein